MNGFKALSILVLVIAVLALTEGRAAKREDSLDNVVRALEAFAKKKRGGKELAKRQHELSADEVMYHLRVLEDELFLQKMLTNQPSYDNICLHLMSWLHAHNRAMERAEADKPNSTDSSQVRGLLKRVLFRMQRGGNSTAASVESSTASPETLLESAETVETIETIESDESEPTIEAEEDGVEWIGYFTSCWIWELVVHGSAPDFPDWLWEVY